MWISAGEHELSENIIHLVLAKVPDENGKLIPGVKGISLFIVPKFVLDEQGNPGERNDVVLAGLNHKMGYRGTTNCLLNLVKASTNRRQSRCDRLPGWHFASRACEYVPHDERSPYRCRSWRGDAGLYRLSACSITPVIVRRVAHR
jgi:hypothetical protein